jgi:hypothetical protein
VRLREGGVARSARAVAPGCPRSFRRSEHWAQPVARAGRQKGVVASPRRQPSHGVEDHRTGISVGGLLSPRVLDAPTGGHSVALQCALPAAICACPWASR